MKKLFTLVAISLISVAAVNAASYSFFGNAGPVNPGNGSFRAGRASSSAIPWPDPSSFGGIEYTVPSGLTLSGLNTLSTDFKATQGGCMWGSPRFVAETAAGNVFFYVGAPPNYTCLPDSLWYNTGNLASPTNLVDATQLGGGFYEPWSEVQADYGSLAVTDIYVVVDAGTSPVGPQSFHFDNTVVNSDIYTYELPIATNANQCKNGGWQGVTRSNGTTFKNQGDCVSYTQNGK